MASSGTAAGAPAGPKPRRFTCSWPSGNWSATRCAQCRARAVLPTPAVPPIALMTTVPGAPSPAVSRTSVSLASSAARPVKSGTVAGNWRGTTATRPPPGARPSRGSSCGSSPAWSPRRELAVSSSSVSRSAVTLSALASLRRCQGIGSVSPRSQRTTVERSTFSSAARSSCVRPRALRLRTSQLRRPAGVPPS